MGQINQINPGFNSNDGISGTGLAGYTPGFAGSTAAPAGPNNNSGWGVASDGTSTYNGSSSPTAYFNPKPPTGPIANSPTFGGVPGVGGANPAAPGSFGTSSWAPSYQSNTGYNPLQYADLGTANTLASNLGGNVLQTNSPGSPLNVPNQASIDFGGASPLNAGLLADRYQKYDRATADAMTRAELALQGPRNTAPDAAFNNQFQPLAGGTQGLNSTGLGSSVSQTAPMTPAAQSTHNIQQNPLIAPSAAMVNGHASPVTPLLQLLQLLGSLQTRQQNYNPYGNNRYYPGMQSNNSFTPSKVYSQSGQPVQPTQSGGISQQQLLSMLLGF